VVALAWVLEPRGQVWLRRLQTFLSELLTVLERCQELVLPAEAKSLLLDMDRATIDEQLGPTRLEIHPGLSACPTVRGEEK